MFDNFRDATPAEHIDEYSEANIAFHQAIVQLSKSQIIFDTIKNIFVHVRAIRKMTISQSDRASRSIVDHHADHRGAGSSAIPNWSSGWSGSIRWIWRRSSRRIAIFWIESGGAPLIQKPSGIADGFFMRTARGWRPVKSAIISTQFGAGESHDKFDIGGYNRECLGTQEESDGNGRGRGSVFRSRY